MWLKSAVVSVLLIATFAESLSRVRREVAENYIDYREGSLNLIISAPHGGTMKPDSIRDRTAGCYFPSNRTCVYRHDCVPDSKNCPITTAHDSKTYETAVQIREYLFNMTGKYAYLVANKLHREKLDPNRGRDEATFGEAEAVSTYDLYHKLIRDSRESIASFGYTTSLLVDLHGHSHSHNLTEVGMNISAKQLDSGSYSAESSSTLRYAARKLHDSKQIVTGNVSLGFFLERQSVKSMPSPTNPTVNGRQYFSGGYTVLTHSSNQYDAVQIEIAKNERVGSDNPNDNMLRIAVAIYDFLHSHYAD